MKLKVWWIPQVPGKPFYEEVDSMAEGVKVMDLLARYDMFQYEQRVKDDYCNSGGLMMLEGGGWVDWQDYETGCTDPKEWLGIYDD